MMFGCDETLRWMDSWIDRELDPSAAMHVETHVARCAGCRAQADSIRALKRTLSGLREESAPTSLRLRVTAALDAEDDREELERSTTRRRKHAVSFALTGAALAGVVMTAAHRTSVRAQTEPAMPVTMAGFMPVVEDVAQRHARELPVEVQASDPAEVSQWFRGKVDIPVHPVAFRGMPARLVGARISNVRNQLAAALYYDVGGRRVTVFMFDGALVAPCEANAGVVREVVGGRDYYVASSHGYTVTFTEQRGVGYAVASDMAPEESVRVMANADLR